MSVWTGAVATALPSAGDKREGEVHGASVAPVHFFQKEGAQHAAAVCVGDSLVLYSDKHNVLLACDGYHTSTYELVGSWLLSAHCWFFFALPELSYCLTVLLSFVVRISSLLLFCSLFYCFTERANQLRLDLYTTLYLSSKMDLPSLSRVAQIAHLPAGLRSTNTNICLG